MTELVYGEIISVEEVLHRWHRDVPFLNELSVTGRIRLLQHEEDRVCPDTGRIVHICTVIPRIHGILGMFPTDGLFVEPHNVGLCEAEFPELLWKRQPTTPHKRDIQRKDVELEQARYKAPPQGMTQQQKAALARSENALNVWKPVIAAMIEIAVTIGKEGPKERQTPDLHVYFNERDITITNEQMKFFRKALPAEYKDTKGGPVGKI